jgi:hypothetical protein
MVIGLVGLLISIAALVVAAWTTMRQSGLNRTENNLAMTAEVLIGQLGRDDFQDCQRYVLYHLRDEHDPALGIDGLPHPANNNSWRVGFMYENLGIMLVFGMVDEDIIFSIGHHRLRRSWEILEPYIRAERKIRDAPFLDFFEHAYCQAGDVSPAEIYARLHLRKAPVVSRGSGPGSGRP